jgi:hypothetical protein
MNAVLGVADHSGWAVCVTVAASDVPAVVDRRRVDLIEPGVPTQPYHHETVKMRLPEAEQLVAHVRESVMRTTLARLTELCDELRPQYTIVAMTLRNPSLPYVPVTVAEAHKSYPVMCRADGMMYHDALCTAARRLDIALELHDRGEEIARAADRLGVSLEELEHVLHTAGESLGPPWRKEHRFAAAAAMGVLATVRSVRL